MPGWSWCGFWSAIPAVNWWPSIPWNTRAVPSPRSFRPWPASSSLSFSDTAPEEIAAQAEVIFTAVPHQAAMGMIPPLLAQDCKVVDLSADFRFKDAAVYEKWYQPHSAKDLLAEAVYGLPELHGYAVQPGPAGGQPRLLPHLCHPGAGPPGAE